MLKSKALYFVALMTLSLTSQAACYGSANSYNCNDASGNSYNVQKYGNTTNMQGYNASTGSNWSQNSQTYGNTTQIQGQANGRAWNETIQTMPGMTTYSGTNSQGQPYMKTCTAYGCN
jgi:ABC-type uncharacterized transport system permease subunit